MHTLLLIYKIGVILVFAALSWLVINMLDYREKKPLKELAKCVVLPLISAVIWPISIFIFICIWKIVDKRDKG